MHFKLCVYIAKLAIRFDATQELVFNYGGKHCITVCLCPHPGIKPEERTGQVLCTVICWWDAPDEMQTVFAALADHRLPQHCKTKKTVGDTTYQVTIDGEGHIITAESECHKWGASACYSGNFIPMALMPHTFQEFAGQVLAEMRKHADATVNCLRWRWAVPSDHHAVSEAESYASWSFDNEHWYPMPTILGYSARPVVGVSSGKLDPENVVSMVQHGSVEPVAHELWREAWEQLLLGNQRSALVVGIAAAEIGFKDCIIAIVPETEWLLSELQSPSLIRMLKDYLPNVLMSRDGLSIKNIVPDKIVSSIGKGISLRNKVVHIGAEPPGFDDLESILLSIRDLLWVLDYYRFDDWALEHLRPETRKLFKPLQM